MNITNSLNVGLLMNGLYGSFNSIYKIKQAEKLKSREMKKG